MNQSLKKPINAKDKNKNHFKNLEVKNSIKIIP